MFWWIRQRQTSFRCLTKILKTPQQMIISPNNPIFHDFRDNCEMSLKLNYHGDNVSKFCYIRTIPTTNYFISLGSPSEYFISLANPTTLLEICTDKPIFSKRITSSGFSRRRGLRQKRWRERDIRIITMAHE